MSNIKIDLDHYINECIEILENNGYIVLKNNSIQKDLYDYVENMRKNFYSYSKCEEKTYENIFNDLDNILKECATNEF